MLLLFFSWLLWVCSWVFNFLCVYFVCTFQSLFASPASTFFMPAGVCLLSLCLLCPCFKFVCFFYVCSACACRSLSASSASTSLMPAVFFLPLHLLCWCLCLVYLLPKPSFFLLIVSALLVYFSKF